jgi:predicted glycoside hydrolase/deacetylase ChbG (UPF0249 family)
MARLCICVDDVGLHTGINEAARHLVELSRVHALSCMVGAPRWANAALQLRRLGARIDVGLHLDFTQHPLLDPAASLIGLLMASHSRLLAGDRVRAEIRAQLDTFENALGFAPAFVDGHQHVHQFPVVRDELISELLQRRDRARPWLRCTFSARPDQTTPQRHANLKQRLIEGLGAEALARLARRYGFAQNRALLGVYDFGDRSRSFAQRADAWLREAQDGDLLMCHASQPAAALDPLLPVRIAEFEVLCGGPFAEMLGDAGITLERMSAILGRSTVPPSRESLAPRMRP